ncbi:Eco57I restriction-modification methylase domain-containing protein [Streptomyces sp. NPDC057136]|uniref:Eco57I restriction-modification methylase domain-containing protein n=1 Tax=Streptomyces sp. NPDC057136 TaxID=3346029 RepID=UPI0036358D95
MSRRTAASASASASASSGRPRGPVDRTALGMAAARAKALDGVGQHQEWLDLTDVSGPFLTLPVLLKTWPQLDTPERDRFDRLRAHHADWLTDPAAGQGAWITHLLRDLLEWGDALTVRPGRAVDGDEPLLDRFTVHVDEYDATLRADFCLTDPGTDALAEPDTATAAKHVRLLGMVLPSGTPPTLRDGSAGGGAWAATPADRLARLCRQHNVPLGLVTDGRWWCLVWAPVGGVTSTAVFDTISWNERADRNLVRAWVSLLRRSRFFQYTESETLTGLLRESLEAGEEVTTALGIQVRQAVELLVDAIGRADARAMEKGAPGLYADGVSAGQVYRGSVAVMMRVVFLLFAEECGLLPADNEVYARSYSARFLRTELKARADAEGMSSLEHTTSAWHRLIALFHAVHGGVDHPELLLPAYDGSIFDPTTYAWLESDARPLPIDDLTVLHMLQAVQEVQVGTGKNRESRTLSFRALSVEQIGYVYEGLLSYGGERATEEVVGLIGPVGREHEVPLRELESMAEQSRGDVKKLAKLICEAYKEPKPGIGTVGKIEKLLAPLTGGEREEADDKLFAACKNRELTERLLPFFRLLRQDLRGLPLVIPAGRLYVTESALRKNTGTHYTPRKLAENVVTHALEPLVYEPGPLQTAERSEWVPKAAADILELKVADIAMGSAAFLVAACRYLADRLIEAWEREEDNEHHEDAIRYRAGSEVDARTAVDAESDQVVIDARRQIIEHCLYGVDINPMAVEMAKLSLWLVSMDPKRPFTFLDDRLVAGDSLLGVTSLEQLKAVHLDVGKGELLGSMAGAEERVKSVADERKAITEIAGDGIAALGKKRKLLGEVVRHTARLRLIGDLLSGAALATCASGRTEWYEGGDRLRDLFPTAAKVAAKLGEEGAESGSGEQGERSGLGELVKAAQERAREWLASELPEGGMEREPVHWPLVFPEVFMDRGGFDAVIGNPPFLGGQKLTGAMGEAYREYLVDYLAGGRRGSADLVAYFELRAHALLNGGGQTGLVATSMLARGESREVGLDQLAEQGIEIRRAIKSAPWPSSSAVLEYCAVWTSRKAVGRASERVLGDLVVPRGISTSLSPGTREASWAESLDRNSAMSFQGSIVLGLGFTLSTAEARSWIAEDEQCKEVVFPYLNGKSVNSHPVHDTERWVINFRDWSESQAAEYAKPYERVLERVKPERDGNSRKVYRQYWWQYAEKRPAMTAALANLERCIVMAQVSKTAMPIMINTGVVFDQQLVVFASDSYGTLALLDSALHYWWALDRGSNKRTDLTYTPSNIFETLVRPSGTSALNAAGVKLDTFRRELMLRRNVGLTSTYNLVHDPECDDPDIVELRSIHEEIDRATIAAYGWHDLLDSTGQTPPADPTHLTVPLDHGFHETDQGTRYTIGLLARTEIIDRLRQLNHQAYADEVFLGKHKKPKKHPDMPPASANARAQRAARPIGAQGFDDDGLFTPDNALF